MINIRSRNWVRLSTIGALLYTIVLTSIALTSPNAEGPTGAIISLAHPTVANFLHIPAYAMLAGLLMHSLRSLNVEIGKTLAFTILISFLHGTFMECFQAMIPGRCASISDGILNLVGIAFIVIGYVGCLHFRLVSYLPSRA